MFFFDHLALIKWNVHPICFHIFSLEIRWYGIFFASGVFLFSFFMDKDPIVRKIFTTPEERDRLLTQAMGSSLLGAKLGYVILYTPRALWYKTLWTLQGFSFHGGLIGILLYAFYLSKRYKGHCLTILDRMAITIPWSLALGRIGNFFNSELIGRPTYAHWGVIFPYGDWQQIPRHPSQLYEALGEGLFLGGLMYCAETYGAFKISGLRCSLFLMAYGIIRLYLEQFRQPDPQIGFILYRWTLGQILCAIMIAMGFSLWTYLKKTSSLSPNIGANS